MNYFFSKKHLSLLVLSIFFTWLFFHYSTSGVIYFRGTVSSISFDEDPFFYTIALLVSLLLLVFFVYLYFCGWKEYFLKKRSVTNNE
jgi:hypothetical protein